MAVDKRRKKKIGGCNLLLLALNYAAIFKYQATAKPMPKDMPAKESTIASSNHEHGVRPSLTLAASPMTPNAANMTLRKKHRCHNVPAMPI